MAKDLLNIILEREYFLGNTIEKKDAEIYLCQLGMARTQMTQATIPEKTHDPLIHGEQIFKYAYFIGKELKLDEDEIQLIGFAAKLHDVGKLIIPEYIVNKPEKLNELEWLEMRKHPIYSEALIQPFSYPAMLARHHHERIDGKGYPDKLKDKDIPLGSKIIAVIDSYNAMTHQRPYNIIMPKKEAVEQLVINSDTQFDSEVAKVFCKYLINIEKILS